jgi:hypothetical protein
LQPRKQREDRSGKSTKPNVFLTTRPRERPGYGPGIKERLKIRERFPFRREFISLLTGRTGLMVRPFIYKVLFKY